MADLDLTTTDFTDKRNGRGVVVTADSNFAERANADDIKSLKARLTALDSTSYSAARLATMTKNDMLYALRLESSDSAGI
jgi:hypothetical protein